MAGNLIWKDLSVQQIEKYLSLDNAASKLKFLESSFSLPEEEERRLITLDLLYYSLQFGVEKGFTADKLSVLFSIMKMTHENSMANFWPARRSFKYFKDLVLQHSVQRPPFSVGLFVLQDVKAITDYASQGYFRHYMLYKYAFTKKTEMSFSTVYTHTVSVPDNFLQPLGEAEDENQKLKKEEQEAMAKLEPVSTEVTAADLEAAGVPEDIREKVLAQVNEQLTAMKSNLDQKFQSTTKGMESKLQELEKKIRG